MTIKLRGKINFPATVTATGGIQVVKANGIWTVSPNFAALTSITASAVSDPTTQQVWIYNPTANSYAVLTLAALGDALFKLTSTTSLAIGTGSKVFATQSGKDVGVGQYVLAVSDAAPSTNFMFGQITAYASGSLTVNVTTIGGSGTYADWTIRVAGAVGATGATGSTPGILQAYSTTTADADPGAGTFRLNNATPASATAAYLDNLDSGGSTVSTIFDLWDDSTNTTKGFIRFQKSTDPTVWAMFAVTGSVVDGTGYRKLTLSSGAGSGAFTAADTFAIGFFRSGDKGADGTVAGPGVSVDSEIALWSGTGGATLKRASGTGIAALTAGVLSVSGTGTAATFGTIELGAATDTTISRSSAGVIAVEGVTVPLNGTSQTATFGTIELGAATDTTISRASAGVIAVEGVNLTPNIPVTSKSVAYTTVLADANTGILHPTADNNARTFTIDSNANVAYPVGTTITFQNEINTVTIAITTDTMTLQGAGTTGSRTLAANGIATAWKTAATKWVISGSGLT